MKKIMLKKKLRELIVISTTIALIGSVIALSWSYLTESTKEFEEVDYYYLQEYFTDYRVVLKPTDVFKERILDPGGAYIADITDHIIVNFEYLFFGERDAVVEGRYSVEASLIALVMHEQVEKVVWEKQYDLVPTQQFGGNDSEYSIQERFIIPFAEYLEYSKSVMEETGFSPPLLNLVIKSEVLLTAETEEGVIEESLYPTMFIPLRGHTFDVSGNLEGELEGALTKTGYQPIVLITKLQQILPFIVSLLTLMLLVIVIFTAPTTSYSFNTINGAKLDLIDKEVERMFKKYKDRIVKTSSELTIETSKAVFVESFDDLLKLSDDIERPILYTCQKEDSIGRHIFYLIAQEQAYAYGIDRDKNESLDKQESGSNNNALFNRIKGFLK